MRAINEVYFIIFFFFLKKKKKLFNKFLKQILTIQTDIINLIKKLNNFFGAK
jgi:hypothetical protein